MRYRKLTSAGDYSFGQNALDFYVNSPQTVAQAVLTRLLLHQGEWFLDLTFGMPWESQVLGYNTKSLYDAAIQNEILGVQGVRSILSYSSDLNTVTRKLTVNATIDTIYSTFVFATTFGVATGGFGISGYGVSPYGG